MVAQLTVGRERYEDAWELMEQTGSAAAGLVESFLALAKEDIEAYRGVIAALRLPRKTDRQKTTRVTSLQKAMKGAATVPFETLRASEKLLQVAVDAIERGNPTAVTDAGAAAQLAHAAAQIAAYNILINLTSISDETFVSRYRQETETRLERIQSLMQEAHKRVSAHLS
jgi:formiminotetrahydrofolate cyclodeaminase